MTTGDADFIHRWLPAADARNALTVLVLHGTGGDENDLVPLAQELLPSASILSPRGKVTENGAARFFRRLAEGVFDLEDLAVRTDELTAFLDDASTKYGFDREKVCALGFSNGANIAASMLLRRGAQLKGATLLSPMLPFEPDVFPDLSKVSVFVGAGLADTMIPPDRARALVDALRRSGANVTDYWHPGGHTITHEELRSV
ncbi:MAG TPA: alpha/beta hydrolase, partial [Gemmatimonadaceae bacterium]|nr:alpha/beta hydrolase [Gemmatimonadaceae bacterium]